ncbi:MAG: type IV secretory system conjugative DNA transfer family protein [Nitrospiraceae bacterium]|nr:type IV secretory system conjugative DNA transfer family protein [Nitrospiraceae bacterium]
MKHHRMLTEREAFIRRLLLCVSAAAVLTAFYFISTMLSVLFTTCAVAYIFYDGFSIFLPSGKFKRESIDSLLIGTNRGDKGKASGEKAEDDVPTYAHTFPDDRSIFVRLLSSRQGVVTMKLLLSGVLAYVSALFTLSLSWYYVVVVLLGVNMEATLSLSYSILTHLESLRIEEYPTEPREKITLWFLKKFSASRGFYFIGEVGGKRIGLSRMDRFMHTLVGGPTGSLKSSSLIIPPLLHDAESVGSVVIPDRKSPELFNWVAGRWHAKRKKVFLFDPWHPDTIGINFLHGADDQDLLDIVEVLMHEKEEVVERVQSFFTSRTKFLLYAILKLAQSFKDEYCNLSTVFTAVESVERLDHFVNSTNSELRSLFSDFGIMHDQEKVNALTSIRERLEIFMDEDVRKAFSKPEFNLSMLFREKDPCLLVIGAPMNKKDPGRTISSLIVNLIINMAFNERTLHKRALQKGEKSFVPNDLYLYLDELRSLKITALADLVSIARETRTHVIGSITDIGFFKYYREDFSSLMGNFRTQLYMRGMDIDSCKYICDSLGKESVVNYKYLRGVMAGQEQRNLLEPNEIKNLPDDKIIVFSPKTPPFVADKVSIHKTAWLKKMQVRAPKNMRTLYEQWGLASGPLRDPVLPMVKGQYDIAAMKSGKPVKVDKNITIESFHKEMGGGIYRKLKASGTHEVEGERRSLSDDEDEDLMGAAF